MSVEYKSSNFSVPDRAHRIGIFLEKVGGLEQQLKSRYPNPSQDRLDAWNKRFDAVRLRWSVRKSQYDSISDHLAKQHSWFAEHTEKPHKKDEIDPTFYQQIRTVHEATVQKLQHNIPHFNWFPDSSSEIKDNKTDEKPNRSLEFLRERYFLAPDGSNAAQITSLVNAAVTAVVAAQGEAPTYTIAKGIPVISDLIESAEIPLRMASDPEIILNTLPDLIQGIVKAGHPFMVKNIIPTASLPALAAYVAVSPYMANGVTGEDAAQMLLSELASASAISKLAGIDHTESAGVFTFGGTGTNLYAMKIGLSKASPHHNIEGVRDDVVVIESAPSHYSHKTAVDWLGLGQDNLLKVSSHPDQTTKLDELEQTARTALDANKKLACIIAVGGTTSNMGIDDIQQIAQLRDRLVTEYDLPYSPHIHVDSVLGWAFLNFGSYDFDQNPLRFKPKTLIQLRKVLDRVQTFQYADSFGVDFHKTGYVPYMSSMIVVKDKNDLQRLERDGKIMTPLFHDDEVYNPGKFTLETSRSTANMLATWVALQTFGQEGYQSLLGHAIEMGIVMREQVERYIGQGLYLANQENFGPDVFVRCYPPKTDPKNVYEKEMSNNELLRENNAYGTKFFKWLNKHLEGSDHPFAVSKSSAAIYTHTGKAMDALRIYPLSPYITEESATELVTRLVDAKKQFDQENN